VPPLQRLRYIQEAQSASPRTAKRDRNCFAPRSVLREFLKKSAAAWSAVTSPKQPKYSCAITARDFPGSQPTIFQKIFQNKMASFFQKSKSNATHDTRCASPTVHYAPFIAQLGAQWDRQQPA
jgi:hypothetical protein